MVYMLFSLTEMESLVALSVHINPCEGEIIPATFINFLSVPVLQKPSLGNTCGARTH